MSDSGTLPGVIQEQDYHGQVYLFPANCAIQTLVCAWSLIHFHSFVVTSVCTPNVIFPRHLSQDSIDD